MTLLFLIFIVTILCFFIYLRYKVKLCTSPENMAGKVIIVTGANSGIGFELSRKLATRGAKVILACRNEERGIKARDRIINETRNNDVIFKRLDLASLSSVRKFCEDVNKTEIRIDILVNNAGVYNISNRHTFDGIVEEMQINVFGPFLLTLLLLPLLKKSQPSRIVNMSSIGHYLGCFKPDAINKEGYFHPLQIYANSKFCNVLFSVELAKRLKGTGVTSNAVHPGIVYTQIAEGKATARIVFKIICWLCYRTVQEAAETPLYLSVAKECEMVSGKYFVDCEEWPMRWGTENVKNGKHFWEYSKKLVGYNDEDSIN